MVLFFSVVITNSSSSCIRCPSSVCLSVFRMPKDFSMGDLKSTSNFSVAFFDLVFMWDFIRLKWSLIFSSCILLALSTKYIVLASFSLV